MTENNQTLNNDPGINQEVGGLVAPDAPKFDPDSHNTYQDIDDPGASSVPDDKGKDKEKGDEDGKKKEQDDDRFDKHPRFQELNARVKEAELKAAQLQGTVDALSKKEDKKVDEKVDLPFKDISAMTDEEISEWQADDPKGFAANLKAQAKYEAEQTIRTELEQKATRDKETGNVKATYDAFENSNPDFRKMWDSGEIIKYINENPGHNPISAYRELTIEAKIAEAVATAKKETEAEVTKKFLAKQKATVLTGGPSSHSSPNEDPKLSNTKQYGGRTVVLADKLREMRQRPQ